MLLKKHVCAIGRQDEKAEEKYWNKVPYEELINATLMPLETVNTETGWTAQMKL